MSSDRGLSLSVSESFSSRKALNACKSFSFSLLPTAALNISYSFGLRCTLPSSSRSFSPNMISLDVIIMLKISDCERVTDTGYAVNVSR